MKNKAKSEPFQNLIRVSVRVMVFNATSNNISVISWRLVSLVDEIGVSGESFYSYNMTLHCMYARKFYFCIEARCGYLVCDVLFNFYDV
jgi:hypothetical protein